MPEKMKEELSVEINNILGTEIDLTKLTKDELTELHEALVKFKEAHEFPLPLLDRPIGEILDQKFMNRPLRDLTLADVLGLPKERKGLFGFGVLGHLLSRRTKSEPSEGKGTS